MLKYYTDAIHQYSTSTSNSLERRNSTTTNSDGENIITDISESSEDDDYDDEIEQGIFDHFNNIYRQVYIRMSVLNYN